MDTQYDKYISKLKRISLNLPQILRYIGNLNCNDAEISENYKQRFKELCQEYKDVFSSGFSEISRNTLSTMVIDNEFPTFPKTIHLAF